MMVLGSLKNADQAILLNFFLQDFRVSATSYIEMLDMVVKLWIEVVAVLVPVGLWLFLT